MIQTVTLSNGREYEVEGGAQGPVRIRCVVRTAASPAPRYRHLWKAGEPVTLTAACVMRAAAGKAERYQSFTR
jgi:hypothetical protein